MRLSEEAILSRALSAQRTLFGGAGMTDVASGEIPEMLDPSPPLKSPYQRERPAADAFLISWSAVRMALVQRSCSTMLCSRSCPFRSCVFIAAAHLC
jgi:hypothetical protein